MKKTLAAIVLATAVLAPTAASASTPDPVFPRGLPTAYNEDACYSVRCVWDARHQGNGEGHSVILTRWHGEFLAKRISHHRAHRLQALYCARPSVTCDGYES